MIFQYSHVPACQISTSYYVGFAYMMMRRYADAIQTFSSILLYIQRTKQLFQTRSYQNDQVKIICGLIF
jgi:translation initiation factor 3 subunit L